MWFGIFLIVIAVPLLELALLIKLGQAIGVFGTLAVLFMSAGLGFVVMQAQGWAAFNRASDSLRAGKPPVEPMLDSFLLMIAGGLLVAPGLLSDAVALLLLIPPVRRVVAAWWLKRYDVAGSVHVSTWQQRTEDQDAPSRPAPRRPAAGGTVIEGEFERIDERTPQRRSDNDDGRDPRRKP